MSSPQRGFTLIELLVVVFIVGVIISFASLNLGGRSLEDQAHEEARRLNEIFRLARDDAALTGLELGWLTTEQGYRFLALSDQGWAPYGEHTPLRPRKLPQPFQLEVKVDDLPLETNPERVAPQVLFLSSGEITPFAVELSAPQLDIRYRINGNLLGQLELSRVTPDEF